MTQSLPQARPLRILIFALGGEGGGVLMNWIVSAARASGRQVQATSVPGVAQRTGSTSYYIEIAEPGSEAVLNLVPMAGRVDVLIASELVEVARALELGFVAPELTTLIGSTNRVYATAEKIDMGDGRYDGDRIVTAAEALSKASHLHDFAEMAEAHSTFISATLFGALAGSGVLPWNADMTAAAIGDGPRHGNSRRGFDAARLAVAGQSAPTASSEVKAAPPVSFESETVPEPAREVVALGLARVSDYQDPDYGQSYLGRVRRLAAATDPANRQAVAALTEAARRLALWMAYEDVARVADLKTRRERFDKIREEARVEPGQLLKVTEYMKPRAEELADILPVRLGRFLMSRADAGKRLPFFGRGLHIRSNSILGYWMLRAVAQLKRIRRKSLRFEMENAEIETWIGAMEQALRSDQAFAEALAALPRLRKGYSDTLVRGCRAYSRIFERIVNPALADGFPKDSGVRLRRAISAALADDKHVALGSELELDDSKVGTIPVLRPVAPQASG